MADDIELVEIDNDAPSQEERDRFEELVGMIRTRCNGAGIEIAEDEGGDFDVNYDLYFSAGRERRRITIWDIKDAEVLLSSKFENIRFLEDYHAFFPLRTEISLHQFTKSRRGLSSARRVQFIVEIIRIDCCSRYVRHRDQAEAISRSILLLMKLTPRRR